MRQFWIIIALLLLVPPASYGTAGIPMLDGERVTLRVQDKPLREVVQMIEQATQRDIVYSDALIAGVTVTYTCKNEPLPNALAGLLQGTHLTFVITEAKQIVLVRRKPKDSKVSSKSIIQGYIQDAHTGERLPFANIALKHSPWGTASQANGYFQLDGPSAGTDTLRVHYVGYEPANVALKRVIPNQPIVVRLEPKPVAFQEIIVEDQAEGLTPLPAPSAIRIPIQAIEALPTLGGADLFQTIERLPGISQGGDGTAQLVIRGSTPNQNLILYDGITLYHADHFLGFVSALNANAIRGVQVFKGGFPARYGGRTAGVVDIEGHPGYASRPQATVHLNVLNVGAGVNVPIFGKGALRFNVRRSYTQALQSRLYRGLIDAFVGVEIEPDGYTEARLRPDMFRYADYNGKLSLALNQQDHVAFSMFGSQDEVNYTSHWEDFVLPDENLVPIADDEEGYEVALGDEERTKAVNIGWSASWTRHWSPAFKSHASLAYIRFRNRFSYDFNVFSNPNPDVLTDLTPEEQATNNTIRDWTVRLDHVWQMQPTHRLEFGFWLAEAKVGYNYTYRTVDSLEAYPDQRRGARSGLYAQHSWSPIKPLRLSLGGRGTLYVPFQTMQWEPRASFRWTIHPSFHLKGAWGHFWQYINRVDQLGLLENQSEFWALAGTEFYSNQDEYREVQPSQAIHRILGFTFERYTVLLDVEVYRNRLYHLAEFGPAYSPQTPFDPDEKRLYTDGTGEARGLEVLIQKKTGLLRGWISYSLGEVTQQFAERNEGQVYHSAQDRRHELETVATMNRGDWTLSASWFYASGRPYTAFTERYPRRRLESDPERLLFADGAINAIRLPATHRLDVSLNRHVVLSSTTLALGLTLFNLYDQKNLRKRRYNPYAIPLRTVDFVAPGFTPTFSIKATFN